MLEIPTQFKSWMSVAEAREVADKLNELNRQSVEVIKFLQRTIKRDGREHSKVGWSDQTRVLEPQITYKVPEWPFRISMGGANRG